MAILGHTVDGQNGKDIARIVDVLIDGSGQPVAAVIDFGGFLGVGTRKIAVDWKSLKFSPNDKEHPIVLDMSTDQIRVAPAYKEEQTAPVLSSTTTPPAASSGPTPSPALGAAPGAAPAPPADAAPPSPAPTTPEPPPAAGSAAPQPPAAEPSKPL